jgi:hypothetical protein
MKRSVVRDQVEVGVRNGSEEQRFARFRFRDLDFVSIVLDLDDVADRALWGAIGPMLIAPETDFRVVRPTIWHTHSFPSARAGPERGDVHDLLVVAGGHPGHDPVSQRIENEARQ